MRETDLYPPLKAYLENQGYEVKGEVGAVDIAACRGEEPPLIIELKTGFSLSLFHQAVERLALTDLVYMAVPRKPGKAFANALKRNIRLCRRLGLGLITVRLRDHFVEVHCDPGPYSPRKSRQKTDRLLREFAKRKGDPNKGGATRTGLVTAYRQDALRCLQVLSVNGASKAADVARTTGIKTARRIMADNHYGWFERASRGIYALTPEGEAAVTSYSRELAQLADTLNAGSDAPADP